MDVVVTRLRPGMASIRFDGIRAQAHGHHGQRSWRGPAGTMITRQDLAVTVSVPLDTRALADRARRLCAPGRRVIIGITGCPGAGKSTLVTDLLDELGGDVALVPMDGFHLAQSELERLGRAGRKGAPDTFDPFGYISLLERLRAQSSEVVYAPTFRRDLEEPIANAICVDPDAPLLLTEGNYLLLDQTPWVRVRDLLDESWFLDVDQDERISRLVARHMAFGRPEAEARRFVLESDQANASLVEPSRDRADLVILG